MSETNKLTREFLAERDTRIFTLKKSGLSNNEIARKFNMTPTAVAAATRRQLARLNTEAALSYPEVLRLELERLDELQRSLWPLTQFRRETLDDGNVVVIEPDQGAVRTVLGILDRRARLLGLNVDRAEVAVVGLDSGGVDVRSSLVGAGGGGAGSGVSVRDESLKLLELMVSSGVLDEGVLGGVLGSVGGAVRDVVDVDVVDDDDDDVEVL